MLAHRLVKAAHVGSALNGEGARRVGGRWNPPGLALVYCASSLSLAVLEMLVHVDLRDLPDDLWALRLEVPDELAMGRWQPAALPERWRQEAGKPALQALGGAWLKAGAEAVLLVPSVIIPSEANLLIHPGHPEAARIRVVGQEPFTMDSRLLT